MVSNSWIVVSRATGKPIGEFYSLALIGAINRERYEVLTALEWLQRFNASVRLADVTPEAAARMAERGL